MSAEKQPQKAPTLLCTPRGTEIKQYIDFTTFRLSPSPSLAECSRLHGRLGELADHAGVLRAQSGVLYWSNWPWKMSGFEII